MNPDCLLEHVRMAKMGRRDVLRLTAGLGAVGALAAVGVRPGPAAGPVSPPRAGRGAPRPLAAPAGDFTDDMFDVAAVRAGAWDNTAFYQKGDQRGTFNEVTPAKTASALGRLQPGRPVATYNLGDLMFNGYPAF